MNGTYNGGINANTISLEVQIGTAAVAYTEVHLITPPAGDETIAQSSATDPNIAERAIGTAGDLRGKSVVVVTNLDLTHIPADQRKNVINTISHRTILSGGMSGTQVFTPDQDDIVAGPNNINVVITKAITLT